MREKTGCGVAVSIFSPTAPTSYDLKNHDTVMALCQLPFEGE
jgi:hypothetical protein